MDLKGATELARLLEERHGVAQEPIRPNGAAAASAAPIFHWLNIEPPSTDEAASPAGD
jgi:hypothetical protein